MGIPISQGFSVHLLKIPSPMAMFRLRRVAATAVALLSAALLAACGGASGGSGADIETGPLRVTGGGVGRYRERGADNSIEAYGHEASRAELEQAAAKVHEYLVAR